MTTVLDELETDDLLGATVVVGSNGCPTIHPWGAWFRPDDPVADRVVERVGVDA